MYTVTGYDASAHVAEETRDAEISAAKGVWQSVALSGLIGWLSSWRYLRGERRWRRQRRRRHLAGDLPERDVGGLGRDRDPDLGGRAVLLRHGVRHELFADVLRALARPSDPGHRLWASVNGARGVPGGRGDRLVRPRRHPQAPALGGQRRRRARRVLRGRLDRRARPLPGVCHPGLPALAEATVRAGAWNLGNRWKWINPIAVIWVIITSIYFCLPFYGPAAVWWDDTFDWNAANFTPARAGRADHRDQRSPGWAGSTSATRARSGRSSSTRAWASPRRSRRDVDEPPRRPPRLPRPPRPRAAQLQRARTRASARARACASRRPRRASTERSIGSSSAASASEGITPAPTAPARRHPARWRRRRRRPLARRIGIRLELEQKRLVGQATVHAQRVGRRCSRALPRPRRRRATRCPRARRGGRSRASSTPCMPGQHRSRVRLPPRGADARQARQHARAAVPVGAAGQLGERRRAVRHAELAAEPLEHRTGGEHSAVYRVLRAAVDAPGYGRQQPSGRVRHLVAHVAEHEHAGPVGGLDAAGHHAAGAGQRGLLVHDLAAQRQLGRPGLMEQRSELAQPCRGPRAARRAARRTARTDACRSRASPSLWSWVREAVELSVAKPAPRRSQRNESTVPIRSVPASRARWTGSSCSSSQASLRGGEVGVERQAAERRGSPPPSRPSGRAPPASACPARRRSGSAGLPVSASQASTDSPWWSRPHATTSSSAAVEQLGDRLDDELRAPPRRPARPSPASGGGSPCRGAPRATGWSRSSKSAAFTPVVPSSMPSRSTCGYYHTGTAPG